MQVIPDIEIVLQEALQPFYSSDLLARSFLRIGLPRYIAYKIAHNIWETLDNEGKDEQKLYNRACSLVKKDYPTLLPAYKKWARIMKQKKPFIILVAGGTGIGTSTLAVRLAWLMEINHIVSTDSVREIVRRFLPAKIAPALSVSTYQTATMVKGVRSSKDALIFGFLSQSQKVLYGIESVIQRSIKEQEDIIIEGIHLVPGEMDFIKKYKKKAHIIEIMLDVHKENDHKQHFLTRHLQNANRIQKRYLNHFKEIRIIQNFLVQRAHVNNICVIENYNLKKVEKKILDHIYSQL